MEAVRGGAGLLWGKHSGESVSRKFAHTLENTGRVYSHSTHSFFFQGSHSWAYTNFVTELEVRL